MERETELNAALIGAGKSNKDTLNTTNDQAEKMVLIDPRTSMQDG
jgi:hypothetical protein